MSVHTHTHELSNTLGAGIVSVATLLAGCACIPTPRAIAEEAGNPNTITVHIPTPDAANMSASLANSKFSLYKIADYANVTGNGTVATGYDLTPASPVTQDSVRVWIHDAYDKAGMCASEQNTTFDCTASKFVGDAANLSPLTYVAKYFYGTGADLFHNEAADNKLMRAFANAAKSMENPITTVTTGADAGDALSVDAGSQGLFLITQDGGPSDQVMSRAMIVGTPITAGTTTYTQFAATSGGKPVTIDLGSVNLKAQKVAATLEFDPAQNNGDESRETVQIGSMRHFRITANVPDYADEYAEIAAPVYSIASMYSDAIKPTIQGARSSLKVFADASQSLALNTDYTVWPAADGKSFTVQLSDPKAWSGRTITVTYGARINGLDAGPIDNKAQVTFSNTATSRGQTSTSELPLYTTRVGLQKIAFGDVGHATLDGATFTVKQEAGGKTTPVYFQRTSAIVNGTEKTEYQKVAYQVGNDTPTIAAGDVLIAGLGADSTQPTTYTFTETKAPNGYILGEHPVTFTVTVQPHASENTRKLDSVIYTMHSKDHANFLDESDIAVNGNQGVTVNIADSSADDDLKGGMIRVENTTNVSDFAKTGGELMIAIWAVVALAAIGSVFMLLAHIRRRRNA